MATHDDRSRARSYHRDEDACLTRTAEAISFEVTDPEVAAAAAQRRVNPFRRVLAGLFRGIGRRTRD